MGTNKELAGSAIITANGNGASTGTGVLKTGAPTTNLTNSSGLNFTVIARLTAQVATNPGEGVTISLYLVPIADGTNAATVDTSTPYISPNYFVGYFDWPGTSTGTNYIMDIPNIPLEAYDYVPYILNNLNETISANWTLAFYPTQYQY